MCVVNTCPTTLYTSATTITTITYLNLFQLENYKKTFQSFWIPFMEQFIPATTIWVAGERWCAEPCTIISPCDYDFELVEAEVSVFPVPTGFLPPQPMRRSSIPIPTTISSVVSSVGTTSTGLLPQNPSNLLLINNIGLTSSTLIIRSQEEAAIDLQAYRSRFTAQITEVITP
jgi:hypothetical protein